MSAQPETTSAAEVELVGVTKQFGRKTVLSALDLRIEGGTLLALLGPSGCGKTTTLRVLAGFDTPSAGRVLIDGTDVTRASVKRRGIGIVFQAYSLFPHMTARENVAYGLRVARAGKTERSTRADELLDLVGLSELAGQYPQQLSGGQQQRVALARALAVRPRVLLLDEPLSALDAKVRAQLRGQIRQIQQETGTTTLMVTHDQEEALTMADQIGVMSDGRIEQLGTPSEIYQHPRTAFVSEFVGAVNRIPATVDGSALLVLNRRLVVSNPDAGLTGAVDALIRPEDLRIDAAGDGDSEINAMIMRGAVTSLDVTIDSLGTAFRVDLPSPAASRFHTGDRVRLTPTRDEALVDGHRERAES
ncbi:ABC transporter ATP-binding protein [Flexivirga caeni]|uniref:ABC-type quaternary amine transporter n=1 Tax=Flexivirga caeni TaxID=2294115 RepID=A0A3M9M095_9MICO|nr:ABC transporter ATP-binding protein [Flexivirga caeni]RNI18996.1 ABC transporter ATP-binding protein [Flexivirga caeni]